MVPESSHQSQGDRAVKVFVFSSAIGLNFDVLCVVSVVVGIRVQRVDIHLRGEARRMQCEGVLIESCLLLVGGPMIYRSDKTSNDVYFSNMGTAKILASVFYTSDEKHYYR